VRILAQVQSSTDTGDSHTFIRMGDNTHDDEEGTFSFKSFEDSLVDILSDGSGKVPVSRVINGLRSAGLLSHDPRLKESMKKLKDAKAKSESVENGEICLDKSTFKDCVKENMVLIKRAFTADFVIPEFRSFCNTIQGIYDQCKDNDGGEPAQYIPQLARYDPKLWGVTICTTDGQRHSIGDVDVPFSIQSCSKPLNYALALHENGAEYVHKHVGHEPSGESFNHIKLSADNKPHNPMINAGAIVTASLVQNKASPADRFDYALNQYRKLAGNEHIGFNNAVFLSERETADRNFALGYYMKENKCFPEGVSLLETLDFYFQLCSIEVTAESAAVIAATLANGGYCPISGEKCLDAPAVRNTLSLMHSCGMYDYSGQFAFKVGLPAKSGVSGVILLVIPNVCGMCIWSPPLDRCGNSVRGIQFCEELVRTFNFHHFDNLKHSKTHKADPRIRPSEAKGQQVTTLLFGAFNGDLTALRRYTLYHCSLAGKIISHFLPNVQ